MKKLPKGDGKAFDFFERAGKENFFKYFVLRGKNNNLIKEKAEKIIELSSSTSPLKYLLKESAFLELLCSMVEGDFGNYRPEFSLVEALPGEAKMVGFAICVCSIPSVTKFYTPILEILNLMLVITTITLNLFW